MQTPGIKGLLSRMKQRGGTKERRQRPRIRPPENTTVLIVDDSRTAIHMLKQVLLQGGYKTLEAPNGENGIHIAKENHPDLILMDVVMPGMNGFQATREIRKNPSTENIPIIMVSGNQQATDQIWGTRLGANEFIPKPVSRQELFQKVETLLNLNAQVA